MATRVTEQSGITAPSKPLPRADSPGAASTDRSRPYITVVVTAYRRRVYLREAVQSVVDQTLDPSQYEIVVFKDFTDPEIDPWLSGLPRTVRVVTEDIPLIGEMVSRGVEFARGEVVCFLDDDDRFRPAKLQGLFDLFREDPRLVYVRNAFYAIDAAGHPAPTWLRYRPQAPESRTVDLAHGGESALPWIQRYGGHVNESTMSFRRSVLLPYLPWLRKTPAAQDIVLFTAAALSEGKLRFESERWNDYRVHPSTSHPGIQAGGDVLDLRDVRRSNVTAELMREIVTPHPDRELARRFAEAYRLEVAITTFDLDPEAHLAPRDWVRFARAIVWRRQRYLLIPWGYSVYRIVRPTAAMRAYRAYRFNALREAAGAS